MAFFMKKNILARLWNYTFLCILHVNNVIMKKLIYSG